MAGGDDNGAEYFRPIWKSSEGQYAAQLASGRWVHIPIEISGGCVRIGDEVIEDAKPAGFDERIMVTTDWEESIEKHGDGSKLFSFIDAATSTTLRAKWRMDGATSLEEAAQMLEHTPRMFVAFPRTDGTQSRRKTIGST